MIGLLRWLRWLRCCVLDHRWDLQHGHYWCLDCCEPGPRQLSV